MNNLPQFGKKEIATESHVAMLKGAISLAWLDGALHDEEIARLQHFIDNNAYLNVAQRQQLHEAINQHHALEDIWAEITDALDRAHLINIATLIFWEDMEFCEAEKKMFQAMHEWHIGDLEHETVKRDLVQMAQDARLKWVAEEKALHSEKSFLGRVFSYLGFD
jgi:hypothetical protein